MSITIEQYQKNVDYWIKTVGVRYYGELTNLGILMEEVGELSRILVRKYGDQSNKKSDALRLAQGDDLADEFADVLWVLTALANQCGVDLTDAIAKNIEKKNSRDSERHRDNPKLKN